MSAHALKPESDPARVRRLALLGQVASARGELFAHANGLPEPKRTEARTFLRDLFTRAAGKPAAAPSAPKSSPRKAEMRLVVTGPANDGSKGPRSERCGGLGRWSGEHVGAGPCFGCKGSGVQRARGVR